MTDTTTFDPDRAPMQHDRTAGWSYFRDAGPVAIHDGNYFLISMEAVQLGQKHPEIFSSAAAFDLLGSPLPLIPIAVDPPDHKRFRKVLDPMLAPRVINEMEDELRSQVGALIDAFATTGSCDIVADLARLYPTQVFLTLFGLPLADRDQFIAWADTIVKLSAPGAEPSPEVLETALALFTYLQQCVDARRADPGDDMLSRILALDGEDKWTDEEVLGLCFLFVLAGLDTVTAEIGFVVHHLATEPELRQAIVADPSQIGALIEEVLRLELPAPITPRVALDDVEVCGTHIPKGANVFFVLGAANRDPERFGNPHHMDLDAAERGHLGFGGGIHRCLGSHLARRELRLVVEELHKRIPDYSLAPGEDPVVTWPAGTLGLQSLRLVF